MAQSVQRLGYGPGDSGFDSLVGQLIFSSLSLRDVFWGSLPSTLTPLVLFLDVQRSGREVEHI